MHTPQRRRPSWPVRLTIVLAAIASLTSAVGIAPANASVYGSCTISRCSDARSANSIWAAKGYPTSSGWYSWPDGNYNYTGGRFYNREGQLPSGATYYEYDVYSRAKGAARDAYRIVVNRSTGAVWFSPNHYTDFYRL
ncbi:ribonuclease domain-containing protein [Microtetraspora sp. NBRC 16547]|uniref:ribonuclease domain-containing protein n=1 Tax=Microtetraspora sp. NBRC 16547 TaxID=3030993 RepID=UPI0024A34DEC|nr:ribonuclease domain-containing protein [Microtetraspora sp. NBRC 16547]GLW99072.1 ribonuclease N1 [Microtetraspora sp. NBRC 16547]